VGKQDLLKFYNDFSRFRFPNISCDGLLLVLIWKTVHCERIVRVHIPQYKYPKRRSTTFGEAGRFVFEGRLYI